MTLQTGIRQPDKWLPFPYNTPALDYQDFGGTQQPVEFRLNVFGEVEVRGGAKKATAGAGGQLVGTFPAGYTPPKTVSFPAVFGGGQIARVDVDNTGKLTIQAAVGAGQLIALSSIRFYPG